jgi:osmotically-inducible protein OsmY
MKSSKQPWGRWPARLLVAVAAVTALSACAPLVVGGAVGTGVMVANDRRTSGTIVEDQGIELRAAARLREAFGDRARVVVTSHNRKVLLTGEVPSQTDKALAVRIVAAVENVNLIVDELAIQSSPSLTARSADALVSARVRAALIDARDVFSSAINIGTERGNVYLMGRVTQREADRVADITRSIQGVQRVIRVFEIISEEELARIQPRHTPQGRPPVQ